MTVDRCRCRPLTQFKSQGPRGFILSRLKVRLPEVLMAAKGRKLALPDSIDLDAGMTGGTVSMTKYSKANTTTWASRGGAMLSAFFMLYGGLHVYAFVKIDAALGLPLVGRLAVAAWMVLMTFLPLTLWRLEKHKQH